MIDSFLRLNVKCWGEKNQKKSAVKNEVNPKVQTKNLYSLSMKYCRMKKYTMKILICYHKKDVLIKDEVLTPIHVGRAIARERSKYGDEQFQWLSENMIGDDTGENISKKNASYNELTAVYWAWKNYDKLENPDYIGLMHYRRHFLFRESYDVVESVCGIDENYFKFINYNEETIEHLFDDCDYVAHIGHVDEVYKHYKENHHIEDLDLAISILKEKYPEYTKTAEAYLKMSYVNLCNMFIMPRDMFFEYCGWLFNILGEFENRIDLTDKRLFISERLTGIFIEHKKRKGLRQKSLSATFIQPDAYIPIALPYNKNLFLTAVTMASVIKNAEKTTHADFYILHSGEAIGSEFDAFIKHYPGNRVTLINVNSSLEKKGLVSKQYRFPEHYPLIAAEVLDGLNKILFLDERAYFFGDVNRLYSACNNDEYTVLGLPAGEEGSGPITGTLFSMNLMRLRSMNFKGTIKGFPYESTAAEVFNTYLGNKAGSLSWWMYYVTNTERDGKIYYKSNRGDQRFGVWDHSVLYFDIGMEPWINLQGLYSIYWWEVASTVPACIPFPFIDKSAIDLWYDQSAELCMRSSEKKVVPVVCTENSPPKQSKLLKTRGTDSKEKEKKKSKKDGRLKKTIRYYKMHGFKQTVKKIASVLRGK